MRWIDEYNIKYRTVKKNNEFYLIRDNFDKYKGKKTAIIIVKGLKNVKTYIKNNKLKRVKKMFEFLYEE